MRLGRYRILYVESSNRIWAGHRLTAYSSDDLGESFQRRASYLAAPVHGLASAIPLASRVIRGGLLGLQPLDDGGLLAVIRGKVLRCGPDEEILSPVLERGGRSMKLGRTPDGRLYAGEYFSNAQREPVSIYESSDDGRSWHTAYRFPAGAIRHVHAITYDKFRDGLLVLTGDLDHESQVLFTNDSFTTPRVLAQGSQKTRAAGVVPVRTGLYLPTDTPFEKNHVQFLGDDGELRNLTPIAGSCLGVCQVNNWAFFGTAVEPSPVNRDPWATLYGTPNGIDWHVIGRWHVDFWSRAPRFGPAVFQMGRVLLPGGENRTGFLFATTVAVRGADEILHRWRVCSAADSEPA